MAYSIWDAFQSYWNNSGGGGAAGGRAYTGIWYGGTGTGGSITGHVIGANFPAAEPSAPNTNEDDTDIDWEATYDPKTGQTVELIHAPEIVLELRSSQSGAPVQAIDLPEMYLEVADQVATEIVQMPEMVFDLSAPVKVVQAPEMVFDLRDSSRVVVAPEMVFDLSDRKSHDEASALTHFLPDTGNVNLSNEGFVHWRWTESTVSSPDGSAYNLLGQVFYDKNPDEDLKGILSNSWGSSWRWLPRATIPGAGTSNGIMKGFFMIEKAHQGYLIETQTGTHGNDMMSGNGVLSGGAGNDGLTGGIGSNALYGGAGNDWLDGGAGGDILDGGDGWDVVSYLSATSGITVDLTTNQNSGAALGDVIVDVEVLQGTNFNDMLTGVDRGGGTGVQLYGEGGDDGLIGKGGGDALYGGDGNDWLDGGPGGDILDGGAGWDVLSYQSAASGVTVNLTTNANGGAAAGDRISNVEVVQGTNSNDMLTGVDRGNGNGVQLYGEGGDDGLTGKAGGDALYGGAGNDWLDGGPGSDILDGGEGWDVVSYLSANGSVTVDLTTNQNGGAAAGDRISNIEVLQGTNANDYLTGVDRGGGSGVQLYGEGGNDNLTGKGGGDYLFGGSGNDWLDGGGGSDILNGGAGQDSFAMLTALGAGNVDRIEDFSAAEGDRIVLSRGAFANMASGSLSSGAFKLGTVANTAEQHILYNQSTGELFYDADGSGAQAAIKFAVLTAGTVLAASNFLIL